MKNESGVAVAPERSDKVKIVPRYRPESTMPGAAQKVSRTPLDRVWQFLVAVFPWLFIAGLLYAAVYSKPRPVGASVPTAAIERRDVYFDVAVPSDKLVWAVGARGKIVRSNDGGESWQVQRSTTSLALQSIAAWDGSRAVVVGNDGLILRTLDGGTTWHPVAAPKSNVANKLMRVRATRPGTAWAVGEYGALLRTVDYGATWERMRKEEDIGLNDVWLEGANGWVVGEAGRILRTTDEGKTWTLGNAPERVSLYSVRFSTDRTGLIVGQLGTVLSTSDGGESWIKQPTGISEHLFGLVHSGGGWIAAGDHGMLIRTSADGSWGRMPKTDAGAPWYTDLKSVGYRIYVAGARLGYIEGESMKFFDENARPSVEVR